MNYKSEWTAYGRRLTAAGALLVPALLGAQRPTFGSTLFWESGLINAPSAYVSPLNGDLTLNFARLSLDSAALPARIAKGASYNLTASASILGRAELGISIFSGDLQSGFYGKIMAWDQSDGIWRRGVMHWLPSIAFGVRNISDNKELNRLAVNGPAGLNSAPSFYGVATRTMVVSAGESPMKPKAQLSITAGFGNGIFSDDAGAGESYASGKTGGLFGGASLDFITGKYSTLSLILEDDAWGINAGGRFETRGVRFSMFATELGSKAASAGAGGYAGPKIAMSLGWQTNVLALLRGNRLDAKTQNMEREQAGLERQVAISAQLIATLEGQIDALRVITTQEKNAERAELQRRLKEEQDALLRLQELIKAREAAKKPPEG
jgi:hypothetical protein